MPPDTPAPPPAFEFGDWLVEPDLNRLSREGEVARLEPKVMDLLVFLARHAGRVIAKEEIIDGVWAQEFVANSALSRSLALLRSALGDDARRPRYIETISKRGLRVLADVAWRDRPAQSPAPTEHTQITVVLGDREIPLHEGDNVIGRARDATIRIDTPRVSRRHARIVVDGGAAELEDLGSKNGTYLRGRPVTGTTPLADSDEISVGTTVLVVRFPADDRPTESCTRATPSGSANGT